MKARDPLGDALELRSVRVGFLVHTAVAIGLSFIPLFDVLGFERAFVSGLFAAPIAAAVGASMVRSARARGGDDLARVASYAVGICLLMLVPSLVAGVIVELLHRPCDQRQGVLFLLLVAGGNAMFGASLGVVSATISARPYRGGALVAASLVAFAAAALFRLYSEPQIFVYSLPFGYWPGSLYDEELGIGAALWKFRLFTVIVSIAMVASARVLAPQDELLVRARRPRTTALLGAAIFVSGALLLHRSSGDLGIDLDRASVERELVRHVRTEHFDIFVAASASSEQIELLELDHEFRYAQLGRFFGFEPSGRIKSFVYESEDHKRRLIGASGTQIARPWASEIHIHGFSMPHPILKHELAHVFAGTMATGPFKVPASAFVLINVGIVEGVAVAADWPPGELDVHGWARTMRALGLAPDLGKMLDPTGFWAISSARAYTIAGSFVRYLVERHGMEPLRKLYASNDFGLAYGRSLDDLVEEWGAFVDAIPIPSAQIISAEQRFTRPGIFQKTCAHKAANLSQEGYERLRYGDIEGGIARIEELLTYNPRDVEPLIHLGQSLARIGRLEEARRYVMRALEAQGLTRESVAEAREALAGLDWRSDDLARAKQGFEEVLALHLSSGSDRLQMARLASLERPREQASALRSYLLGDLSGVRALGKLGALAARSPEDGLIQYLYGLQLEGAFLHEEAVLAFRAALRSGLPGEPLTREAEVALGRCLLLSGSAGDAARHLEDLAQRAPSAATRAQASDWAERARFLAARRVSSSGLRSAGPPTGTSAGSE